MNKPYGGARRAILDATLRLLGQPDGAGAGLQEIATEAGYSRQAVYRHFGSRTGLLTAALADIDERAGGAEAVARIRAIAEPEAELDALVAWWSGYVAKFSGVARAVHAARSTDADLAAAWDDRMAALLAVCRAIAGDCERARRLRPELDRAAAAELLWGLLSIPLWQQLRVDRGWTEAEYRDRLGLAVRGGLLA